MVEKARAPGSGGFAHPGPAPTEIYKPGDVTTFRVAPSGLASIGAQKVFAVEAVAVVDTLHGRTVSYLIAAGNWRQWVTPANLVRVDPPAPSGFVAVPPEPTPALKLAPSELDVLIDVYAAGAVGLAYSPDCKAATALGRDRVRDALQQLLLLGLVRAVRETDDSQGGLCTTPAGDKIAEPLWLAEQKQKKPAPAVVPPPEAGDMTADPAHVVTAVAEPSWRGKGHNSIESADGRFLVALADGYYTAHDLWTGEFCGGHSVIANAQNWCAKRTVVEPLDWREHPNGGPAEVAGLNPSLVVMTTNDRERSGAPHFAADERFQYGADERFSPWFATRELAKRWCEVRACCTVADGKLTYRSPVPF